MSDSTIAALAALATGLGLGPMMPKLFDVVVTAFKRGGVRKKRSEAEQLRAENADLVKENLGLRRRIVRLLNKNQAMREEWEADRLELRRQGVRPPGAYPPIDEDTDGP